MDARNILLPREADELFRYPRGRSLKLAKAGKLPHIALPDGEIRFDEAELNQILNSKGGSTRNDREVSHV